MKWETVRLGDIAEFSNGLNFDKSAYSNGIKLIGVSNFGNRFSPDFSELSEVSAEVVREADLLQDGDIVFVRSNGNKELVGRCMLIAEAIETVTYSGFVIRCRLHDQNKYDPVYFTYHFKNKTFRQAMAGTAVGANIQNLSQGRLSSYTAVIPDIDSQHRIAGVLSAYDDLIENNQKQIKLLEDAAQRLYKEWFIDLRFPGHESTPIHDGIPEGWEEKAFSAVFSYVRGRSYSSKELSDDGILMANLKNIRAFGGYNRGAEKRYIGEYKESQLLSAGDIIMGVTDMTQERRLVGHVAVVPDVKEQMVFSMDLIKLLPIACPKSYLYSAMQFGGLSNKISPLANGVNVLHLKPEAMMNLKMVVPDETTMLKFDEAFSAFQSRIEILQNQSTAAEEARDRLLPKLMSGEIEV